MLPSDYMQLHIGAMHTFELTVAHYSTIRISTVARKAYPTNIKKPLITLTVEVITTTFIWWAAPYCMQY